MGKIEVGVVALHRRTGCAGVVERVFAPGEYRGADGRLVNRAVVQLSSGDALLLDSAELGEAESWEVLDGERAARARVWFLASAEAVAQRLAVGVLAGLTPEWAERLLAGIAHSARRAVEAREHPPTKVGEGVDKSGALP